MVNNSNNQYSDIPWWAIVLGFIFCWPIGMVLLFMSLGGVRIPTGKIRREFQQGYQNAQRRQTPPAGAQGSYVGREGAAQGTSQGFTQGAGGATQGTYHYGYAQGKTQAQQAQTKAGGRLRRFFKEPKSGKGMTIVGAIMSFVFALGFVEEFSFALRYGPLTYIDEWFPVLGFLCAGLFLLGKGISKTRLSRRAKLYQGVIGQRNSVFLSDLASTAGVSEKKVLSDLQKMLSDGTLPMGYIDKASGRLVLTDQGYAPEAEVKKEAPKTGAKAAQPKEDPDDAILRQIREVNDAIPDAEMTRKIDRIEEITRKILAYQKKNPAKAQELRQFLNYYLPTTLKILNAYAQMDSQGIEGENISAAKHRIEGMMDKVVEGFEKQLDQLFKTEVMDITTDVEVLERMLDKDGLGSGMTLGG